MVAGASGLVQGQFVIRTENEDDLGFFLFAAHEGDWPPAGLNDCVFSGFPYDPALLNDPRANFIAGHKKRDWQAEVDYNDEEMTVLVAMDTGWTFAIKSNPAGNRWIAQRGDERLSGAGMFL